MVIAIINISNSHFWPSIIFKKTENFWDPFVCTSHADGGNELRRKFTEEMARKKHASTLANAAVYTSCGYLVPPPADPDPTLGDTTVY